MIKAIPPVDTTLSAHMTESQPQRPAEDFPGGEDDSFVERLRALDQQAWSALYDRHHLQIWRYAYGRTADRDAADDVAAHVFTEALASIQRYGYRGRPILAWLYRIARNLASKHVRQGRRDVPLAGMEQEAHTSPEDGLDTIILAQALRRLTADQREVVALRFYAGYSTREIAQAMRKREPAVYSLEVRALAALRRHLTPDSQKFLPEADENGLSSGIDQVR
jgi:RNA polymerase sigma-70 factor, ECF subfamily